MLSIYIGLFFVIAFCFNIDASQLANEYLIIRSKWLICADCSIQWFCDSLIIRVEAIIANFHNRVVLIIQNSLHWFFHFTLLLQHHPRVFKRLSIGRLRCFRKPSFVPWAIVRVWCVNCLISLLLIFFNNILDYTIFQMCLPNGSLELNVFRPIVVFCRTLAHLLLNWLPILVALVYDFELELVSTGSEFLLQVFLHDLLHLSLLRL